MWPEVWRHGDWNEIPDRGTVAIIYGRSDSTINRGGMRMGTSDFDSAVLSLEAIADALVIDVQDPGIDAWMPRFGDRIKRIARRMREHCSPRHVPDEAWAAPALPRTLSGKTRRVPIKRILDGTPPDMAVSWDSPANPEAPDRFIAFAASRHPTEVST